MTGSHSIQIKITGLAYRDITELKMLLAGYGMVTEARSRSISGAEVVVVLTIIAAATELSTKLIELAKSVRDWDGTLSADIKKKIKLTIDNADIEVGNATDTSIERWAKKS